MTDLRNRDARRSRWLADAVNHPSLPSWLRKLLNHLVKFLGAFKARVELGEMVRQAEEQGVFSLPVRQALAVMLVPVVVMAFALQRDFVQGLAMGAVKG